MKFTPKNGLPFLGLLLMAGIFIILGSFSFQSTKRIWYFESMSLNQWNASYFYFDGNMDRTLHFKAAPNRLRIKIQTDKGSISMEVKDKKKNIIFERSDIQSSELDIPISGDISIHLYAARHKGSFDFEAE